MQVLANFKIMASTSSPKTPRYIELANAIRLQIEQGVLRPGDRLPSFVQIREQYGVTAATVERIYKHLEKDNLVVREQGRGTFVKQPDSQPRTGVIGIYGVTMAQHPYFVPLIDGFRQLTNAEKEGFVRGIRAYREFVLYADYCTAPTT